MEEIIHRDKINFYYKNNLDQIVYVDFSKIHIHTYWLMAYTENIGLYFDIPKL